MNEVKVEAFSDDDGSKNSLEVGHETVEVANIKREIVWEWDSENESKKRTGLQLSENHGGLSIFVKEEQSVKTEYEEITIIDLDPLEMNTDFSAVSRLYPREGKRKHSAEKHYKCSGEKPFKCDQCGYSAAFKSKLIQHQRIHSGEKPFKCDQCGYSAAVKSNLIRHKRIHSGEKPSEDTTKVSDALNRNLLLLYFCLVPLNVITMLENVKEETLDLKIEDENDNSGYIEDTEYNLEMEIKYEPLIFEESLSDSVAGEQTPELDPPAQADPVPVKSTTDGSDTG